MENCQFNFSRCIIKQIKLQETSTDVLNFNLERYESITVISLKKLVETRGCSIPRGLPGQQRKYNK